MKKTIFTFSLCGLLIFTCLLSSCHANGSLFGDTDSSAPTTDSNAPLYTAMIRELENQILELQQNQYISDAEYQQEMSRLQAMLSELRGQLSTETDVQDSQITSDTEMLNSETNPPIQEEHPITPSSSFLYIRVNDTATITGYTGADESVVIPTKIDGYTVTAIADNAFSSDTITRIIIPNCVTTIGWFSFRGCTNLLSITVPSSVTAIGYSAFPAAPSNVTIYCHSNSFAQKYAESYGISYAII